MTKLNVIKPNLLKKAQYLLVTLPLVMTFFGASADATIYKRTLADGTIVYTDIPAQDAVPVTLNSLTSNVIKTSPSVSKNKLALNQRNKQAIPPKKHKLTILSPKPEATIRDNSGNLIVTGKLTPKATGQFQLFMNDKVVATAKSPNFQLKDINRGAYKIQLRFLDNKGKLIASSPEQQVYFHRASVLNRPN